jgi:hypothetical protein
MMHGQKTIKLRIGVQYTWLVTLCHRRDSLRTTVLKRVPIAEQTLVVKESRNRPGVAQRFPGGLGSRISWHSAREGGEVSITHRPPLTPGVFLVLIFTRGWVDPRAMERSEGDMSLKNPVTPPGIDPGSVRVVAQRLNHYARPQQTLDSIQHKDELVN